MSMLHALVLAACEVNIFDLTDMSRSTTCGQTDCFVHAAVDYFWIFSTMLLVLLLPHLLQPIFPQIISLSTMLLYMQLCSLVSRFLCASCSCSTMLLTLLLLHELQSLCVSVLPLFTAHRALSRVLHLLNLCSPLLQHMEFFYADYSKAYQNCPMNQNTDENPSYPMIRTQGHLQNKVRYIHRYIDRGVCRLTSVWLAQARPNEMLIYGFEGCPISGKMKSTESFNICDTPSQ